MEKKEDFVLRKKVLFLLPIWVFLGIVKKKGFVRFSSLELSN